PFRSHGGERAVPPFPRCPWGRGARRGGCSACGSPRGGRGRGGRRRARPPRHPAAMSKRKVHRDAETGEFVTEAEAKARPAETVTETVSDAEWELRLIRGLLDQVDEFGRVLPQESDLPPVTQRLYDLLADLYARIDA